MMVQNSIDNEDLEVVDGSMEVIMHTSREEEYVFEEKDFNYNVDEELHQVVELEAKEGCSSDTGYNIGPHRKWDVNPEHPIVDDSLAKWEDMRFDGLDEGSVLEPSPQPCNSMEEHDDMTLGEDSFLHSSDSYKRGEGCASVQGRRGRGRFGGSHNFSSKGKAKMN
ncbi:hypothetical protein QJS04_geneDACA002796 [Acorus gramineus]|uniref:Uncharacterized protein n=1 Tax=Acorus gramineus TaxID=55184 RepID=A0AAV9BU11_ACOGR|nr:hypothetical protein QJS04_geneDACA002796 [Acorus gramineus]